MAEEGNIPGPKEEKQIHTYPVVRFSDMSDEMRSESVDLCVTACEKYSSNCELAAKLVKETLDKKFGPAFHVVVGESYGFEITYDTTTLSYIFFGGNMAVVIWKCN